MPKVIKLRRGLDIPIKGKAEKILTKTEKPEKYAIKPTDFHLIRPKLTIKEGHQVKAGSPLFFDKYKPDVLFTSPVSGTISRIHRGERRRILHVEVAADGKDEHIEFGAANPLNINREQIQSKLLKAGLWPLIRQRPYSVIANPKDTPKAVFISAFDTAPLAPDHDFIVKDKQEEFQTGINALSKLTNGLVHLNIHAKYTFSDIFTKAQNVQLNTFSGPHPSGNVGIQIHHIDPINKGETAWYVAPQDVITIGRLFKDGIFDARRIVALAGSEVKSPKYYKTYIGAPIETLVKENIKEAELPPRFISGNVLSGTRIDRNDYCGFYDSLVSVIPEGNYYDFMGWLLPGFKKYSESRTFFSWLMRGKKYRLNTNMHGGKRAYVVTGQYEKYLPMDILPVQLIKAILVDDIDKMEQLGIYEVAPEDFALCEFACTSKTNVQSIIRKGLDTIKKEME